MGPTGPANGLNAYGGAYNNTPDVLTLVLGTPVQVPLANAMPALNVTNTPANSLTVTEAGTYEIVYFMDATVAAGVGVTFAVRDGGVNIPSTESSRTLSVGVDNIFSGTTVVALAAGAVLDMAVEGLLALSVTLADGVNASLTAKKLDA